MESDFRTGNQEEAVMRKGLYLLLAMALATGLVTSVLADAAAELCSVDVAALTPPTAPGAPSGPGVAPAPEPALQLFGEPCGAVICGAKQHCCNASCSQCVPLGMECTQVACYSSSGTEIETPTAAEPLEAEDSAPVDPEAE